RTHNVPANRPTKGHPPFTWLESALDALKMRHLDQVTDWSLERLAYEGEGYNGWGYEYKGQTSAYLWGGTNEHAKGKYTSDGHYDPSETEKQAGIMPVLAE